MSVVCLDTYKLQKDSGLLHKCENGLSDIKAKEVGKELQKGYMRLLAGFTGIKN